MKIIYCWKWSLVAPFLFWRRQARSVKNREPSKSSFNTGFTLIELVVIILLLGILAAFAIPKFFNLSDYRARAAYDEVAAAVRYAQKLAVASGCEVQVSISGNSYALQQHSTDCTSGAFTTISDHPVTSNNISGVSLTSIPVSFIFDSMGRSSSAVTVNVDSDSFTVVAETGTVDAQ